GTGRGRDRRGPGRARRQGRGEGGDGRGRAARPAGGGTGGQPFGLGPGAGGVMSGYSEGSPAGGAAHPPGGAGIPGCGAALGGESVPGLGAAAASRVADRVAVTVDGEAVTHGGLDEASGRVAAWLARRVRPGDRVLLAAGAGIGFVRCYLGALRAGAVVVLA